MGRKSAARKPQNIRNMMKGLKNRWGRFQCPRDGSICKSLEAWHWHRLKYHASQNINFIDLDGSDDNFDEKATGNRRSPPLLRSLPIHSNHLGISSIAIIPPHLHLPPLSPSERLLPPEAFAPIRPDVIFPDDVSDLTEPEIPVLLSEEAINVAPPDDGQIDNLSVQSMGKETRSENKNCKPDHDRNHGSPFPHRIQQPSSPIHQTPVDDCHSNHSSIFNDRVATSNSGGRPPIQMTSSDHESIFKMISMQVIEMFDPQKILTVESVLPRVEEKFSRWGLSRDAIVGVVTGTLVGAMDQWKHGYETGWRDGTKEVLHAPLLTNLALQRRSLESNKIEMHSTTANDLEMTWCSGEGRVNNQESPIKERTRERGSTNEGHLNDDFNNNNRTTEEHKKGNHIFTE